MDRKDEKLEFINTHIANYDNQIDTKFEKKLQSISIQIIELPSKHSESDNELSPYENRLKKMNNSNKIRTSFDTAKEKNEEYYKMKIY